MSLPQQLTEALTEAFESWLVIREDVEECSCLSDPDAYCWYHMAPGQQRKSRATSAAIYALDFLETFASGGLLDTSTWTPVKAQHVGWLGPYGIVPGDLDQYEPVPPSWRPVCVLVRSEGS